ncbi:MAG: FAD-dependent oxidoreductase [Caldilineaceae bacterium]
MIAGMAGCRTFTIHPRKGEEYLLDKRLQGLVKRVIFPCPTPVSKGILVIPTYDGTIMVGPTAESVDDREDLTTSAAGAHAVFSAVQQVVPGISARDCIAEFAGLRAPADGEDFIIGPTDRRGFINVAGIQSPGLTAAPAIATLVVDMLRDEGLTLVENAAFQVQLPPPVHFAGLSTDAQTALARGDPSYGRIVCRCEVVTEAEVAAAIARGAATLDGIKFRTRGMGRCQGGFCTTRCMELLARSGR